MANQVELVPELLEAGVHFDIKPSVENPKMKPFIFERRNAIYIINLDETVKQLQLATNFLQDIAHRGGKILFVGCKKQAQEAVGRSGPGLRAILRQSEMARRHPHESRNDSQKHRTPEVY